MQIQILTRALLAGAILSSSLNVAAENKIIKRERAEILAITQAKKAIGGGGQVVSTDKDLTNWDINILKGCFLHEIEVSRSNNQIVSHDKHSYCGNGDALRQLHQEAHQYKRTHR